MSEDKPSEPTDVKPDTKSERVGPDKPGIVDIPSGRLNKNNNITTMDNSRMLWCCVLGNGLVRVKVNS